MTIYEAIGSHDQRLYSWWVVSWISAGIFEKGHLLLVYWRIQPFSSVVDVALERPCNLELSSWSFRWWYYNTTSEHVRCLIVSQKTLRFLMFFHFNMFIEKKTAIYLSHFANIKGLFSGKLIFQTFSQTVTFFKSPQKSRSRSERKRRPQKQSQKKNV